MKTRKPRWTRTNEDEGDTAYWLSVKDPEMLITIWVCAPKPKARNIVIELTAWLTAADDPEVTRNLHIPLSKGIQWIEAQIPTWQNALIDESARWLEDRAI